jgi:predicted MFS family arabinose efflux permease
MLFRTVNLYKNAYAGLSKSTWLMSMVMLINRSGTMVVPFMSLYLINSLGFTVGQAGFVYGIFGAGAMCGAFVGGRLTDKIGFYPVQIITLMGGGVLFIVLGQMTSYPVICVFTFLLSFVNEAFRPANSTAVAFYSKEENRTRSYALNRLAINLGWSIGSLIGGVIAKYNYHLLFWIDGLTNIIAGIILWVSVKPVNYHPKHQKQVTSDSVQSAYKDKTYLWFIVLVTLFGCCFFQLFSNLSVYYNRYLHFSEPLIGITMALNGLMIVLFEMVMVYKLEGKRENLFYIAVGTSLVALAFMLLGIPGYGIVMAFIMVFIITIGEILAMPFMNSFWVKRSNPGNRGQYAALYTIAWSGAQTMGPMVGAQIAQHAGFQYLWWGISVLLGLVAFGFWELKNKIIKEICVSQSARSPSD